MDEHFKIFSHNRQLEFLEGLKKITGGILDRKLISDIQISVNDSKSHAILTESMVHITAPHSRYKAYMDFVVAKDQEYINPKDLLKQYAEFLGVDLKDIQL